ncbi:MAG: LPS export ABC transporter permease LptG [Alphaproteobacteria bacterium]|nr:LPS export ABC transporter permease LptG [Alphaproteobacteria bacterium]
MKKILTRYTIKQFLWTFLATLFCLTAVILLFDMVELLRIASKKENISFFNVGTLALLKSPMMIHIILPFVVLLTSIIFFLRFNKSSELTVMRAVGVSVWNILLPLCSLVFIIGLIDVLLFSPISAKTSRRYERLEERLNMTSSTPFSWSESGFWWRDNQENGTLVLRASQIQQEDNKIILKDLSLFDLDNTGLSERQIESPSAVLQNGQIKLQNAMVIDPMNETLQPVSHLTFDTTLNLERLLEKFDDPQTMSFWRFPRFIRFLKEAGFSARAHEVYFHELIAFPVFLIAMFLVASLFTFPPSNRQGGTFLRVLSSIGSGFLLYFLSRITNVLGHNESLPLILAAWAPALICIPLCLSGLLSLEDG